MADKVLVTGITGYIGQHCGAELLKNGYEVIGSIRSQSKAQSVKEAISNSTSTQKLDFIELDLLNDEGWSEAMEGCKYVLHVASPFVMKAPKDENDLIKPAVQAKQPEGRPTTETQDYKYSQGFTKREQL